MPIQFAPKGEIWRTFRIREHPFLETLAQTLTINRSIE